MEKVGIGKQAPLGSEAHRGCAGNHDLEILFQVCATSGLPLPAVKVSRSSKP